MRAALEQAREELGADALVLETREIRAGGFMGIGSRPMVELRVAASETPKPAPERSGQPKQKKQQVNLTDDELAWPLSVTGQHFTQQKRTESPVLSETEGSNDLTGSKGPELPVSPSETSTRQPAAQRARATNRMRIGAPAFATLAAKTYANGAGKKEPATASFTAGSAPATASAAGQERINAGAELNLRAGFDGSSQSVEASAPGRSETRAADQRELISRELARLRAELRAEMRAMTFSISAFAHQPAAHEGVTRDAREVFDSTPEIFDSPYYETYLLLTQTGMSPALARQAVRAAFVGGLSEVRDAGTVARAGLAGALPNLVRFADDALSFAPGAEGAPAASVFIGPTGVGKTTTIAKLAARVIYRMRRRVELITLDTWRIAAAEQLKTYAEIIGVGCHVARSLEELEELINRMSRHAVILVDTAGRSPLDLNDCAEFCEYLRRRQDVRKFLVLPATTHPTDAEAALAQFTVYGADRLVLTKLDETARPGAAVSVAASAGLPLAYLCNGQRVPEDLERATPLSFAKSVVGIRS
jgi:flagellar biosynthesis protein FlhF